MEQENKYSPRGLGKGGAMRHRKIKKVSTKSRSKIEDDEILAILAEEMKRKYRSSIPKKYKNVPIEDIPLRYLKKSKIESEGEETEEEDPDVIVQKIKEVMKQNKKKTREYWLN